jgi:hypothetical protein
VTREVVGVFVRFSCAASVKIIMAVNQFYFNSSGDFESETVKAIGNQTEKNSEIVQKNKLEFKNGTVSKTERKDKMN